MTERKVIINVVEYCKQHGLNSSIDDICEYINNLKREEYVLQESLCKKSAEVFKIKGEWFILTFHADTSAPCSNCYFFNRGTLSCNFPIKEAARKCTQTLGELKGWNTLEYSKIHEWQYKDYPIK